MIRAVIFFSLLAACWTQHGRVVRPKIDENAEVVSVVERSCPQDEWDSVKGIREFSNWTPDTLPEVDGFTVMLTQSATTVASRCYGTQIRRQDNGKMAIMNIFPAQPSNEVLFDFGEADPSNTTETGGLSKQLMIAGASPNFIAYATCNTNSSHINIFVTYRKSITDNEKNAINRWIKSSDLPQLGRWAAINFDTCSFTKTMLRTSPTTLRRHLSAPKQIQTLVSGLALR
ncbi:hypothetical protein BIW11_11221 [Tropilaelaps mercedesae]|uniref:Uncharacterized protein n=1 Tax=Tropilaelaps mercedesae TaxID=418985 RepID=A0A1V9XC02_9ACAR|nr:hypothetical protein BIW11_11221 [Tropilaelaps mercedesae]